MIKKHCRCIVLTVSALGLAALAASPFLFSGCSTVDRALYTVQTNWTPHIFVQTNVVTVTNTVPVPVVVVQTNTVTITNSAGVATPVLQTNVFNVTNLSTVLTLQTNVFSVTNLIPAAQLLDRPSTEAAAGAVANAVGGLWGFGGIASAGVLGLLHLYRNVRNKQFNTAFIQAIQTGRELLATTQGEQAKAAYTNWLIQHQTASGVISAVTKMVPDLVDNPAAREAAQFIAAQLPSPAPAAPTTPTNSAPAVGVKASA
jgi:hypothetical protein